MSGPGQPTLIFETVHGSHAYGLAGPKSDLDLKGIVVGPATWYHGYGAAGGAIAAERPEAFAEVVSDFLERHEAFVISRARSVIHP